MIVDDEELRDSVRGVINFCSAKLEGEEEQLKFLVTMMYLGEAVSRSSHELLPGVMLAVLEKRPDLLPFFKGVFLVKTHRIVAEQLLESFSLTTTTIPEAFRKAFDD